MYVTASEAHHDSKACWALTALGLLLGVMAGFQGWGYPCGVVLVLENSIPSFMGTCLHKRPAAGRWNRGQARPDQSSAARCPVCCYQSVLLQAAYGLWLLSLLRCKTCNSEINALINRAAFLPSAS